MDRDGELGGPSFLTVLNVPYVPVADGIPVVAGMLNTVLLMWSK